MLGGTLTMAAAMGVGRFAYTPLLPQMQQTFGWSFSEAGDVASANYIGYMIGALLAARAVRGPRGMQWLGLSLMASVVSIYLGVLADSFAAWIAVRLFSGIASAYCLVLTTTMLGQLLITTQQTRLANLHFTGVGLGIVLTVLITWPGGSVSSQWLNLAGLSAVLMALAWFAFRTGEPGIELPPPAESSWIPSVGMWRLVLGYGCFGFGYVVTATFIVAMAHDVDVSRNAERSVWLLVGLAVIPSVYVWQKLAERAGVLTALKWAYLVEAVGVLVAGWFSSAAALVAGGVLLGGTFAGITALGLSAARQYAGQDPAGAIARMTAAFAFGQLIGPAVSGRLAEGFGGFAAPSLVASSLLVVGYLLLWRFPEPAVS